MMAKVSLHAGQVLGDALDLTHDVAGPRDGRPVRATALATKKPPWSSEGRNPVGVCRAKPNIPPPKATASTTPITDSRSVLPDQVGRSRPARHRCRRITHAITPRFGPEWRRKTAHKAGDSVSALMRGDDARTR